MFVNVKRIGRYFLLKKEHPVLFTMPFKSHGCLVMVNT